jgi:tetratricopeptide (TPR) repeat protein
VLLWLGETDFNFQQNLVESTSCVVMARISAALIVRNESAFIEDCLRSLAGHVDEIILVDTGSNDDTIEIASRFPIRLHHFAWCDDFSAARNFALERASGDWILAIDADERLEIPDREAYDRLLADDSKVGWELRLHPRVGWTAFSKLRLFRNEPRIRFQGVVHEKIEPSAEAVAHADGLEIGTCDLRVVHVSSESDRDAKSSRYIPLLRRQLASQPDNFYCWWHLGECLRLSGDEDAASAAWSAGLSQLRDIGPGSRKLADSILYLTLIKLQMDRGESSEVLIAQAMADFPDHLALQWLAARRAAERGDFEAAQPILEKLLAIDADTFFEPRLAYDKALFRDLPAQMLALCHFRTGRFDEAARLYRFAAQTAPDPDACRLKARLAELRLST